VDGCVETTPAKQTKSSTCMRYRRMGCTYAGRGRQDTVDPEEEPITCMNRIFDDLSTAFTKRIDADKDPAFSGSYSEPLGFTPKKSTRNRQPRRRGRRVSGRGFGGVARKVEGLGDENIIVLRKDDGVVEQMVE